MIKGLLRQLVLRFRLRKLKNHGENVWIGRKCIFQGSIQVGSNVNISRGAEFISTRASIRIHDYVVFGPYVTIYTGNHVTDLVGKHIIEITDEDKGASKNPGKYDADVTIEAGCWIGTHAIILKGVTIGRGSVVGAGAVVTKDLPPYSVCVGVPQQRIFSRFSEAEIAEHERILRERNIPVS